MVSKNGVIYYNEEEKQRALSNNNALEYALNSGYDLVKNGGYYKMRDHDSLVFTPEGRFHWNSQSVSGNALDFIQAYEGKSEVEAVLILAGSLGGYTPNPDVKRNIVRASQEKPSLELPARAANNNIVFGYLIKTRGISPKLLSQLVTERKVYQSEKYNNVVMVGMDKENNPKYVSLRSTNTRLAKPFKADAVGSDKSYPFVINGKLGAKANTVCVVESPIEAMSYYSLCELLGSNNINYPIVSLGGSSVVVALDRYLKDNPQITNIILALNNDKDHTINAGEKGMAQKIALYGDKYNITLHRPHLNDWNDVLKNYKAKQIDQQKSPPQQQKKTPHKSQSALDR